MGTNCKAKLTIKAKWEYVGTVASKLLGAEATKKPLGDSYYAVIKGFDHNSFKTTGSPEYIYIMAIGSVENPAAKIALTLGLVRFFGGEITYNDATCDHPVKFPTPKWIGATNGLDWQRLHQEILDLKPLAAEDIEKCQKWAAY